MRRSLGLLLVGLVWASATARPDEPARKAVAYLSVEVPRWSRENHCFSCHNNGDGARALYLAKSADPASLAETTRWLRRPEAWDAQGNAGPATDKRLARLQFAAALATAVETGASDDRPALHRAVEQLVADLAANGSWEAEEGDVIGSPATFGSRLATAMAIRVLRVDGSERFRGRLGAAESWLRSKPIANVVEASAVLMIEPTGDRATTDAGRRAVAMLLKAESSRGGWGPYPGSPVEAFDTALALIGLTAIRGEDRVVAAMTRGRRALVAMQKPDGSFPGTTRPPGGESYAEGISTTARAAIALIQTSPKP